MSDKILDTSQLVNGLAILLSFYVGYKYGMSVIQKKLDESGPSATEAAETKFTFSDFGEYKMLLVVRNDLKMGKGKIAAQCGHAAVGAYQSAMRRFPQMVRRWETSGCAKIAVKVESERELMDIKKAAQSNNFNTCVIRDAGRTQIEPNTKTVLAIGPAPSAELDRVTRHLKLL